MTFQEYANSATRNYASHLDDGVRLRLKQKPWWVPLRMWYWLLQQMFHLEFFVERTNQNV
jgi:hypothetical protein